MNFTTSRSSGTKYWNLEFPSFRLRKPAYPTEGLKRSMSDNQAGKYATAMPYLILHEVSWIFSTSHLALGHRAPNPATMLFLPYLESLAQESPSLLGQDTFFHRLFRCDPFAVEKLIRPLAHHRLILLVGWGGLSDGGQHGMAWSCGCGSRLARENGFGQHRQSVLKKVVPIMRVILSHKCPSSLSQKHGPHGLLAAGLRRLSAKPAFSECALYNCGL